MRWDGVGVFAVFANLGGEDPCAPASGRLQAATLTSSRWRTERGLAVGDGLGELRRLHPDARREAGRRVLVSAPSPVGLEGEVAVLAAEVMDETVRALAVHVGAAGD